MKHSLEVVRAGAGSGKTTDLCQTVADAVANGLDPARILATTFTKKAAAELKGRIQAKLLSGDGGRAAARRHADRLELAAIGTVHSVALQLLARYAIELGLSPRLEVITEHGSDRALRDLLGAIPLDRWQLLADHAERLGITDFDKKSLALLAAKRGNRISDAGFRDQMAASAERVCQLLALQGVTETDTPADLLVELAKEALEKINTLTNDTYKNTKTAKQDLRRLQSRSLPLWGKYLEAANISASKKSGADTMLDALRIHASSVGNNPRLHSDIRTFASLLTEETLRLESQYIAYKAERGLVDFTDLETLLLDLLETKELAPRLAKDFDLVLVDEFQDTNPLQLAIFQRLRAFVSRNRWVGDPKQAIYGFRDTDPQLVNDIWDRAPQECRTKLPNNHRSQKGLVQVVGTLFASAFGDDAQQVPQQAAIPRGVERWIYDSTNQQDDATALACGISELHAEGIRFGDIAVLERANRSLRALASALDSLRIPYLIENPGLFSSREGAMLLAGLRLVADRSDSLAAATVMHLLADPSQATPQWITDRLTALRADDHQNDDTDESGHDVTRHIPWESDPILARLEHIDRTLLSPSLLAQVVIEALELPRLLQKWGDPARRCSNLDSALSHANNYEELAFSSGKAATLSGLILHLEELATEAKDMRYTSQGHDAVTLMTYHGAKGLEWPVVVLSGLNSGRAPYMWSPVVTGSAITEEEPLAGRTLRCWTWPFGMTDGDFPKLRTGSNLETDALQSPEGAERSQRETNENLRLLYVGCTRAKQKLVFAHRAGAYGWLNQLADVDILFDPNRGVGEYELHGIDTTFVIRHLNAGMAANSMLPQRLQELWIACGPSGNAADARQRIHSPSKVETATDKHPFEITVLPGQSYFPTGIDESQYSAIGDAVHSYMAALPSMQSLTETEKNRIAERCLSAYSMTGIIPPSVLVSSGERFCRWVDSTYPAAQWHVEFSVSGPRSEGGDWAGTIDLALQLPTGEVVIVDHKSAPIRRDYCAAKAASFSAQLDAYREIMIGSGAPVASCWIHFPFAGVVAKQN
ncbi:MAG: UvrD/REP helicase [Schlesneria sp.]|nr:UvrD/REP helicase [Schlesneria sp.]